VVAAVRRHGPPHLDGLRDRRVDVAVVPEPLSELGGEPVGGLRSVGEVQREVGAPVEVGAGVVGRRDAAERAAPREPRDADAAGDPEPVATRPFGHGVRFAGENKKARRSEIECNRV